MPDHEAGRVPSAIEFIEGELRRNPDASFAEVKERAEQLGILLPPFLYGQTRRQLGLTANPGEERSGAGSNRKPSASEHREPPSSTTEAAPEPAPEKAAPTATEQAAETDEQSPPKSGFELAVQTLRITPDLSYQDLKARAELAGLKLPPIVYGRAKALLGLVPTKPRKSKKARADQGSRFTKNPEPSLESLRSVEHLVEVARTLHADRERLRETLRKVLNCVEEALGD